MPQVKFKFLLGLFVVLLGLANSRAQAQQKNVAQPYVVFVGIDKYADPQIKPRQFAETDVKALYDLFVSKDHLGVAITTSSCCWAARRQAAERAGDEGQHSEGPDRLEKSTGKDDLVIFGFFGEGRFAGRR